MNRGYLLPPGCKDLIDAMNLKAVLPGSPGRSGFIDFSYLTPQVVKLMQKLSPKQLDHLLEVFIKGKLQMVKLPLSPQPAGGLSPLASQIVVPPETTAAQVAALLGLKPFQIVADVLELGFFVTAKEPLSFEIISSVARKHGFLAIKAAS